MRGGGEEGIRTLDTLITYTPLAGERLQPLGHLSARPKPLINMGIIGKRVLSAIVANCRELTGTNAVSRGYLGEN